MLSTIFTKGNNFITSCLLPKMTRHFQNGSTLNGKNLLLKESQSFPLSVDLSKTKNGKS